MGKPSKPAQLQAEKVAENYNWGEFGSADASGVNFNPQTTANIQTTQSGIGQYLNELINPSYSNESFMARQALLDARNNQYARELGAQAMARGARGSATQNILNSIAANRNTDMRQAMTQEDARVQNILNQLSGIESGYFNQGNTMANNIMQRIMANQAAENAARQYNTEAENQYRQAKDKWKNQLISTGIGAATTLAGSPALGSLVSGLFSSTPRVSGYTDAVTNDGMYGAFGG